MLIRQFLSISNQRNTSVQLLLYFRNVPTCALRADTFLLTTFWLNLNCWSFPFFLKTYESGWNSDAIYDAKSDCALNKLLWRSWIWVFTAVRIASLRAFKKARTAGETAPEESQQAMPENFRFTTIHKAYGRNAKALKWKLDWSTVASSE